MGTYQPANLVVVQHDECLDVRLLPEEGLQEAARLFVAVDDVVSAAAPRPVLARLAYGRHGHLWNTRHRVTARVAPVIPCCGCHGIGQMDRVGRMDSRGSPCWVGGHSVYSRINVRETGLVREVVGSGDRRVHRSGGEMGGGGGVDVVTDLVRKSRDDSFHLESCLNEAIFVTRMLCRSGTRWI